jgi:hypothetical protein
MLNNIIKKRYSDGRNTEGIDKWWFGDYIPTQEAVDINKKRIEQRLKEMKK